MAGEAFLVSGGAGGIGAALCRALAARGYRPVVGFSKSADAAAAIAKECGGTSIELTLGNPETIAAAIARLAQDVPDLAGVVLGASPPPRPGPFTQMSAEEMAEQWTVNVVGPQQLLSGLVRQIFRKLRRGVVIGILSRAMGHDSQPAMAGMGAYTIAKYGMAGLLAVLAADYPWLRVETVSPGFTETDMLKAFDERFLGLMRQSATFQQPADVAAEIIATIERVQAGFEK